MKSNFIRIGDKENNKAAPDKSVKFVEKSYKPSCSTIKKAKESIVLKRNQI